MYRKYLSLLCLMMLMIVPVVAQDVPDELDDFDDDWDEIIEQLADSEYLDEDDGELIFEDDRVRFDDDAFFIPFDTDGLTDFVMAGFLQIDDVDEDDFSICMFTFRDTQDDGFLATGVTSVGTVNLYDSVFDNDDDELIDFEEHGSDVDDEVHIIIIALDDEITVYADGELFFAEDDLSVREGAVGLLRSEGVDCDLDDLWVWRMDGAERSPSDGKEIGGSSSDDDPELPDEIENFDGASETVMAQFEQAGIVARGNAFLFGEDYAFIGASGSSFISLGRGRNRTDVVMAGEVTFDAQSSNYEQCGILLRVDDAIDPAEDFLFIGIDSDGDLFMQNNSQNDEDFFDFVTLGVDVGEPQHLIIVARGDRLAVYVNGDLALEDYEIYEVRGIFGIAQISDSRESSCEGRDIWVYDTPFFEAGVCNVIASGNVNQRSDPTTSSEIAGQLTSGESREVVAQTEPGDGFIWYELADESFVREDIISLAGDCNDLEER